MMNSNDSINNPSSDHSGAPISPTAETHHERQTLLLMLLAQVCSLHDATPRTFVVHVLALFERGILDDDSIRFLYDLGLVPNGHKIGQSSFDEVDGNQFDRQQSAELRDFNRSEPKSEQRSQITDVMNQYFNSSNPLAIVPYTPQPNHPWSQYLPQQKRSQESISRQREATAIRKHLERHESFSTDGSAALSSNPTSFARQSTKESSSTDTFQSYNNSNNQLANLPKPWSVDHHPLTLSRYQRDFHQVSLLATGAFGSVYHSIHKLESKSYAVKCVTFNNSGYLSSMLALVVREVRCLAMLDHPNCVRYYTSWLEPSWMTGDQNLNNTSYDDDYFESNAKNGGPKLLTDIESLVNGMHKSDEIDDTVEKLEAFLYGKDGDWTSTSKRPQSDGFDWTNEQEQSSFSFDNKRNDDGWANLPSHATKNQSVNSLESAGDVEDSDVSEWTRELDANESHGLQWDSKYWDSKHSIEHKREQANSFHESHSSMHEYDRQELLELVKADQKPQAQKVKPKEKRSVSTQSPYKYQICLFIQMQLCRPTNLSDWIKKRNSSCSHFDVKEKKDAFIIFRQIVNGLEHVHDKGIIHRDLKPANIFAGENGNWCIGDFGLSKKMRDAHHVTPSSNFNKYFPSRNFADGHTAGVGTASYAAPEQITENDYGPEVDIFALGIILLELFSIFTSEHERAKAFYNLRHCRELEPRIHHTYPEVAALALACTQADPRQRPTASDVLNTSVFHEGNSSELVSALKSEIDQRDDLIDKQNDLLKEKDREIEELKQRLMQVEIGNSVPDTNAVFSQADDKDGISSSEDDY